MCVTILGGNAGRLKARAMKDKDRTKTWTAVENLKADSDFDEGVSAGCGEMECVDSPRSRSGDCFVIDESGLE